MFAGCLCKTKAEEMVGFFPNGDWRTWVCCEFPGIDAGRFGGTSLSPAAISNAETRFCYASKILM